MTFVQSFGMCRKSDSLPAIAPNYARQRFASAGIQHRAAAHTGLGTHNKVPAIEMEIDCKIDELWGKGWP